MSNAIMFMDRKRFLYPSVRISSRKIAQRFGINEEIEKYYKYREILEQKIELNIADREKIEGNTMNFLLMTLAMIQIIPILKEILNLAFTEEIKPEDMISLVCSLLVCIFLYAVYRIFRTRTIRKLYKSRE